MTETPDAEVVADQLAARLSDEWSVEPEGSAVTARDSSRGRSREVGVEWDRGRFYARELTPHPLPNVPPEEHVEEVHDLDDAIAHAVGWAEEGQA